MGFDSVVPARIADATAVLDRANPAATSASNSATLSQEFRPESSPPRVRWAGLAIFALLSLYAVSSWTASLNKGQSFDEGLQLAVGYNIWLHRDFRMEGANGDFIKRWATLPYLVSRPHFPSENDPFWRQGAPYETAYRFFFQSGNIPEMLLAQARAMIAVLGVGTGLLVFFWARDLFGTAGAFVSLALFTISPHMLAFGGIVSTDMSITLTLLAATWCIWRLLHIVTPLRLALSLAAFALLVLAKPSALVIVPIAAVLVLVKLAGRRPLNIQWGAHQRTLDRRRSQISVIALLVLVHALAGWTAIWAHYSFRYAARPVTDNPPPGFQHLDYRDGIAKPLAATLRWLRDNHVLPEGFHRGVQLLAQNDDETVSFLDGEWTVGGRPSFFPYAIWAKTTPSLLIALTLSTVAWVSCRRPAARSRAVRGSTTPDGPSLYEVMPLLALIACYLGVALFEELNIGHRHILPLYPAFYILAGAIGLVWTVRAAWWKRMAIFPVLVWGASESFAVRPHYLSYFGPQVGGPENGFRHLVDSSTDWGMELPELKRLLDEADPHGRHPLYLSYFGTDSARYHGLKAVRLPGFFDRRPIAVYPLSPGYYAISATLLQSLYTAALGPWSRAYEECYRLTLQRIEKLERIVPDQKAWEDFKRRGLNEDFWVREISIYDSLRMARLCAWLRNRRPPDFRAGHSILVWKLSLEDLQAALLGPPVELTDDRLPERHYGRHIPL